LIKKSRTSQILVAGRANAGKTLFILNFAEYLGYNNLTIKFKNSLEEMAKTDHIEEFKSSLVSDSPNSTRCLQFMSMNVPVLKGKKAIEFIDSTGISSSIHYEQEVREGMVQTLILLKENIIIFHIIDASSLPSEKAVDEVDMELYRYGSRRGNYMVLANKMDLKGSDEGFITLSGYMKGIKIIKVSALLKSGFDDVKRKVSQLA
jgi:predicted GTPase